MSVQFRDCSKMSISLIKISSKEGRGGGGVVVSHLAFNSDGLSSIYASYKFLEMYNEKANINYYEAGIGLLKT